MKYTNNLLVLLLLLGLSGCLDLGNVEDVEFKKSTQEFAIPLIQTEVSLIDVFEGRGTEETDLIVMPDSSLMLRYSGDVLRQTAADLVPPVPGGIPIDIRNKRDTIPLPFTRLLLLRADLTGDSLVFAMVSQLEEDVRIQVTVPSLLENGSPLVVEDTVFYTPGQQLPVVDFTITSMDGLVLDLYENSLLVNYEAWNMQGDVVDLENVALFYNIMTYSYLEGYFSKNDVNIPGDQIELDIYDQWIDGRLYFAEPKVTVQVDNSFGFPVRADIKFLRVVGRNGQKVDLESPINDIIDFEYPEIDEVGVVKTNVIRYNETNSNIEDILNIQPILLEYDINAIANPDKDSTIIGFMTDSSFIRINVTVDLPVMGWANQFTARDTVDFEIESLEDAEEVEFKMILDNGMPITVSSQLYFVDENYLVLDSLFTGSPIEVLSSEIDVNGRATNPTQTIVFETMDSDRLARLSNARYALMDVSFLTKDAPDQIISIDANDVVGIKMGAKIKTK